MDETDQVLLMLYIKDRYAISHSAYHEMAKICKGLPRQCQLQRKIIELNQRWNIMPMPNGVVGVQQRLEARLSERVQRLVNSTPADARFKRDKRIRVKLSGDGTSIGMLH